MKKKRLIHLVNFSKCMAEQCLGEFEKPKIYYKLQRTWNSAEPWLHTTEDYAAHIVEVNPRGFSFLSVALKIFVEYIMNQLICCLPWLVLPVSQCDFRFGRVTLDIVFFLTCYMGIPFNTEKNFLWLLFI